MSRFTVAVLTGVILWHIFASPAAEAAAAPASQPSQARASQYKNIDLTELTPSLESQLNEAKRLNRADSESSFELNKLAEDAARYELLANDESAGAGQDGGPAPGRTVSLVRDPASGWARLVPNHLRRRSNERGQVSNYNNEWPSRGLNLAAALGGPSKGSSPLVPLSQQRQRVGNRQLAASALWARDSRDYDDLVGQEAGATADPAAPSASSSSSSSSSSFATINNQESASRKSLWTSDLLRDLLIAQEARARARYLDQLVRNYERERAKDASNASGASNSNRREKRRRCKMDPNLGVKNPSFCDTDAYFGAADYGARDVWGDTGR